MVTGKANVNLVTSTGDSPLHYAIRMGLIDMVILLLEEGANYTLKGASGTPMEMDASNEMKNIIEVFALVIF